MENMLSNGNPEVVTECVCACCTDHPMATTCLISPAVSIQEGLSVDSKPDVRRWLVPESASHILFVV